MKDQELPKWFVKSVGKLYPHGADVENPFSGESIKLNNIELSIYDFIKGCEVVMYTNRENKLITQFNKACDWFRKTNPEAYMVLLD